MADLHKSVFFFVSVLLLASLVCGRGLDPQPVVYVNNGRDGGEIVKHTAAGGLSDPYCCLKNGYGCMQYCEAGVDYYCCLKNGYGCMQLCQTGVAYYCCERNGYGCSKMCPTGSLQEVIQKVV